MMLHIPAVMSHSEVSALRERLSACTWVDGSQTVGAQGARVKANRQLAEHGATARELSAIVLAAVRRHPLFFSAALPLHIVPPLFNSYAGGEHYGLHVDGAIRAIPGSTQQLRTDVSSTLFLSEPEEYDGGELMVLDTYGTHEVKLSAGDLIVYPSTSLHQVMPVTRGTRLCAFFWTQSMIADDAKRGMLFQMDNNICTLRERLGDCAEVLSLTAQYHNLLRMWATT
ncbi:MULTISPECIES: Fe2+-dependent dioxygenase [unclassified Undibacterium]|uniref:Fe2+-dependent dioxygenase n=1 Tax=unclassified Undibacterium TaxID=2630295 RepID=UPI002AC9EF82|nr:MULTISPECIES: Fe2+-dependent dioxygenase [unclassified Undibacterium]MEB0140013.1 Fe2+-dependent dioxygenase [Undibacterium sp. CCC2.1]MEB0173033.1 Fe2+-dependent dioxygenase [Undibacterium sp. CCC1.1]MEB0176813.1 Fe2+-dependent dioxygenase [Undibacterium sp. CCC3.4]MEB0216045.1 Fe2+-dependent dioxygenase [Undibacterium sp. 5I2]WPX42193.1 Fe2+-dependent dioxygenase [Undibacterium sp. CCC3.4]